MSARGKILPKETIAWTPLSLLHARKLVDVRCRASYCWWPVLVSVWAKCKTAFVVESPRAQAIAQPDCCVVLVWVTLLLNEHEWMNEFCPCRARECVCILNQTVALTQRLCCSMFFLPSLITIDCVWANWTKDAIEDYCINKPTRPTKLQWRKEQSNDCWTWSVLV